MIEAWFLLGMCLATTTPGWDFIGECPPGVEGGRWFYATEAECLADAPKKALAAFEKNQLAKAGLMCVRGVIVESAAR